jgi:hypothetical protein
LDASLVVLRLTVVIVDSERSSSSSSFWVCATTADRDCCRDGSGGEGELPMSCGRGHCCHHGRSCLGLSLPHYHRGGDDANRYCCCCKGSRGKGPSPMPSWERGKGGGLFPNHCHCGGDDTNCRRCRCKGGSGKRHSLTPSRERGKEGGLSLPHCHCGGDNANHHRCCCKWGSGKGHPMTLVHVFLAFFFECISFDFYYCLCVLLLRSFFLVFGLCLSMHFIRFLPYLSSLLLSSWYKRLVNSINFFYGNDNHDGDC